MNYTNKRIDTTLKQADYVLLPVWMVHYDYNKSEHTFAMNGQTEKWSANHRLAKQKWSRGLQAFQACRYCH